MRRLAKPHSLVRRRLRALERQLPLALEGSVRGVHQTRVASRRLRELLPALTSSPRDPIVRKLRREIRDLTRALGPVRELDVALESLAGVAGRHPRHAAALEAVRLRTEQERQAAAGHLDQARDLDLRKLAGRLATLAPLRPTPAAVRRCAARISDRIALRSRDLLRAVDACGTLYSMEQLHRARIAIKKFRYALELGEHAGGFRLTGTLGRLKQLQDLLGQLHDLHVLAARIRDAECVNADWRDALAEVALGIDEEMRQRHCAFLSARHRLDPVLRTASRVRATLGVLSVPIAPAPRGRRQSLDSAAG